MTTTPIVKFTKGTRSLDLMSGRYAVATFTPPPLNLSYQLAEGTSANVSGGAQVVGVKAQNRTWNFSLHIRGLGSDADGSRALRDLQMFLAMAGDESDPLYLQFRPNSDTPEPLWGSYGTDFRYEVVTGTATVSDKYSAGPTLRARALPNCTVTLAVKPYAVGRAQRVMSALGAVLEDWMGATDGVSRGTIITSAYTNLFTNPVFGNATWNTGWTAAANLVASQNTDSAYIAAGQSSAKLVSRGSTNNTFTQTLTATVATYIISCFVKLPDGSAPTSNDAQIYYNSAAQTTTFTAVGGSGWYLATASVTGVASALATGVVVKNGRIAFVDAFQMVLASTYLPFIYGDLPGVAWTGTAHASTSTSTAGRARLAVADDTFNLGQGTLRLVWQPNYANTAPGSNLFFWSSGAASLRAYFNAADDTFRFTDNTNTATSAAKTFSAFGTAYVLHFTWGPAGLALYVNGAADGTNGTYSPPAAPSYIYLGTDDTPANYINGTMGGLALWNVALTSTHVANDYANLSPLTAAGKRVEPIPYLWTKDGDDVVDNADDGSYNNWALVGGVPGSAPARVRARVTESTGGTWLPIWIHQRSDHPADWLKNVYRWYMEGSGTGGVSGTDSNADYILTTAPYVTPWYYLQTPALVDFNLLRGKVFWFIRMRANASGGSVSTATYYAPQGTALEITDATLTTDTTYRMWYVGRMTVDPSAFNTSYGYSSYLGISITAATTATRVDFGMALCGRLLKIDQGNWFNPLGSGSLATPQSAEFQDRDGLLDAGSAVLTGDVLELDPDRINTLTSILASNGGAHTITHTLTWTSLFVTPRWSLL